MILAAFFLEKNKIKLENNIFTLKGEVTMNRGLGIVGTILVILLVLWLLKII